MGPDQSIVSVLGGARSEHRTHFYGQHNRIREAATVELRNHLAHSEHDLILMPPDAYRAVRHVYEMVRRLWGYETPRGRDYPIPPARSPWVVGLGPGDHNATWYPIEGLTDDGDDLAEQREWHVVLAVANDGLGDWRPGFEVTSWPVTPLIGRLAWGEFRSAVDARAREWLEDQVEILDRLFCFRLVGNALEGPRSPAQIPLLGELPGERWLVVRADYPGFAQNHVRESISGAHPEVGPCPLCAAEGVLPRSRRRTLKRLLSDARDHPGPRRVESGT